MDNLGIEDEDGSAIEIEPGELEALQMNFAKFLGENGISRTPNGFVRIAAMMCHAAINMEDIVSKCPICVLGDIAHQLRPAFGDEFAKVGPHGVVKDHMN